MPTNPRPHSIPLIPQTTGNPSDTVPFPRGSEQFVHYLFGADSDNEAYDPADEIAQPYQHDNWYDDL